MSFESKKFTALLFLPPHTIFKLDISRQQQKKESSGKGTLEQNRFLSVSRLSFIKFKVLKNVYIFIENSLE